MQVDSDRASGFARPRLGNLAGDCAPRAAIDVHLFAVEWGAQPSPRSAPGPTELLRPRRVARVVDVIQVSDVGVLLADQVAVGCALFVDGNIGPVTEQGRERIGTSI